MVSESVLFTALKTFDLDVKKTATWEWVHLQPYFVQETFCRNETTNISKTTTNTTPPNITPPNTTNIPTSTTSTIPQITNKPQIPFNKPFQGLLLQTIWHSIQGRVLELREEINEKQKIIQALPSMPQKELRGSHTRITKAKWDELISDLLTLSIRRQEYPSCFGPLSMNLLETILYSHYYQKAIIIFCPKLKIYTSFGTENWEETLYLKIINTRGGTLLEEIPASQVTLEEWVKADSAVNLLKSISNYKISELKSLCIQLLGSVPENAKKQDLYALLGEPSPKPPSLG